MTSKRKAQSKPPGKAQLKAQAEAVAEDVRLFSVENPGAEYECRHKPQDPGHA